MIERIYVAAPYSSKCYELHSVPREVQQNVDRAIAAGNVIHDKGHYAFVPHITHYTFLDHWATSFLYLAPSYGADEELDRAKKLGLKIYYNLDEIQYVWH